MENLTARLWLAIVGLVLLVLVLVPNFVNTEKIGWPTHRKLNYGLDIQGGLHLVMRADVDGVKRENGQRMVNSLKAEFTRENLPVGDVRFDEADSGEFILRVPAQDQEAVKKYIGDRYSTVLQLMASSPDGLTYRYYESYMLDFQNKVIQQAIETIRNRIDEFGVAEPSIQQVGSNRILVQLPGMADAERAKALINTAAKLDFMMVDDEHRLDLQTLISEAEKAGGYDLKSLKYTDYIDRLNKDLKSKLPEKTIILFQKAEGASAMDAGRMPFLLRTDTNLGGDALTDAFINFDRQSGTPVVALRFNAAGTAGFRDLTTKNVGRRMAIVLDKVVKTAPNINEPIGSGEAQITMGHGRDHEETLNEAKMISTSLRAGALPAALEQLEERRVGPSLGSDSIQRAQLASVVGALLIFAFVLVRYRTMGVISDISLAINILAVIGLLSTFGATLTLPGIAGIALTVGFAVDANVLINERIREELRKGSSFTAAVKEGYSRAMSAILDANITTAATAVVLLYFGTGPVRGFAVTLLIGIVTTLLANVFLSKVIVDTLIYKFGIKKMSV